MLAAFNEQIRRQRPRAEPQGRPEAGAAAEDVHRSNPSTGGWSGVLWSDLDAETVDRVIAAEVTRFTQLGRPWEWKYYSYDLPPDLPERLLAAGFVPEPTETLLCAEIAELDLDLRLPQGTLLVNVVDPHGVELLTSVHDDVFGGDHSRVGREVLAHLNDQPATMTAVVAMDGPTPISAGRVEFHLGTDFASLWGGGTIQAWRGCGLFRSLVAHRAALAAARGFRYLQVDASEESRPILERLGFVKLATTTPYVHPGH